MKVCRVLLVDDDRDVRDALSQTLELAEYAVTACSSLIEATDHLSPGFTGIVVTDVRMPGRDGFDLLERARGIDPDLPVVVLTGEGDIPMAVRAMTEGAYDFLEKPCPAKRLLAAVARGCEKRSLVLANRALLAETTLNTVVAAAGRVGSLSQQIDVIEKHLIEAALRSQGGRVVAAAEQLGLPRKTLYDKLKRHGLSPGDMREAH
ncbi:MAG: response regulator [Pseudomonadota bacterium]